LATGKVLWERTGMSAEQVKPWSGARNMCTAPIYAGGTLIMPDHGSTLTGIDPATGKDLWKLPGKGSGLQVPAKWTHKGQDYVISLTSGGYNKKFDIYDGMKIACIEAKTGRILWEMDVTTIPGKGLSVHGDVAYLTSWWFDRDNPANKERKGICTAYRLGLDKAERLWETPVPDAAGDPIPACNGSVVVVKGLTKTSYLLDPASGKVLATYAGDTGINECHAAIMEDKVIMSRDGSHGSSDMSILGATPETFSKLFCHWSQPHPQTTSYHNKYMTWPMVEGRIFMRGWDGVYCYDLRANK
jgi:outer membrane protein assembly factor BamB